MIERTKIKNKTLFVAALSVYFGLLIVGAPPQILAQTLKSSEISKCFEINQEAEKLQKIKFAEPFSDLIQDLETLIKIKKLTFEYDDTHYILTQNALDFEDGNRHIGITATGNSWLDAAISDAIEKIRGDEFIALSDVLIAEESERKEKRQYFNIAVHKKSVEFSISIDKDSEQKASELAENLTQAFASNSCRETRTEIKRIYENTKVNHENNQVFIVTRLPRAGLDSLLKADEKAN